MPEPIVEDAASKRRPAGGGRETAELSGFRVSYQTYEAGPEATILFATASEYVTELVAKVEAGDSAFRRFLKSSAGPV